MEKKFVTKKKILNRACETAEKKDKMLEAYLLLKKSQKARGKETNQNADRVGFKFKCH